jgi:hypothetical protein
METRNAIIASTGIEIDDRGMLKVHILLDFIDGHQVFGCGVYAPKSSINGKNYAGHFLYRVLEVTRTDKWEELPGKAVRVTGDSTHIEAIGHIVEDAWFNPGKEFEQADREVSA